VPLGLEKLDSCEACCVAISDVGLRSLRVRTNITEPYVDLPSSRGHLLQHFLQNSDQTSPTDLLEQWNTQEYAGFNMLLLSLDTAGSSLDYQGTYVTNHGAKGTIVSRPLSNDERHRAGLSNDVDGRDTGQLWPKVSLGIQSLDKVISSHDPTTCTQDQLIENLFKLLQQVIHSTLWSSHD
jgi:uncharacterized protein with NRDE domain